MLSTAPCKVYPKTYVCIALEFCHSVWLLLVHFQRHGFSQMLNLGESGLCGSCCNQASSKSVKKDPIVKAQMFHVRNGCRQGTQITQKTSQTKTPERSQSIATRYWHEQSPTKNDTDSVLLKESLRGLCAMQARTWCCTSHMLDAYTIVACRNRGCGCIREHPFLSSNPTCEWTPNLTVQWPLYVVERSNLQHNWQVYL